MYDRKTVRRRRTVLGLSVACSLILLTAWFGEGSAGGLHVVQRGFMEVLSPAQEGASRALKPFRDLGGWVSDTARAKGDVEDLRAERDALRRRLVDERGAMRENAQLRGLLQMNKRASLADQRPVVGRVIVRNPNVWFSRITIDKGSTSGVRVDQPVVSAQGLVGRVSSVSPHAAQVQLITDSGSGVSAKVNETGVTGVVRAAVGRPDDLLLEFIQTGDRVREEQTVVTAGSRSERLSSLFPPGIPIGRVTKVDAEELEVFQRVHLRPFAALRDVDFVEVLTRPAL